MSQSTWWWRERRESAALGLTARGIGHSEGPYRGLNLGAHVGDDPACVEHNRRIVCGSLAEIAGRSRTAVHPVFMDQVHGAAVRVLTSAEELDEPVPQTDAVITTLPGVALFALVADCTPVLLLDAAGTMVAAVHAGRPGMLAGVVPATVTAMRDLGARDLAAVVGPSVCGRCYEVPASMRDAAADAEPVCAAVTWSGTPAIDVATGVVEQLRRERVAVTWVPGCTVEESALYSYRRDGRTGRFAGVIMRCEPADG